MKSISQRLICLFVCVLSVSLYSQEKPNIVFILADDLGYADIGPYGQKKISTPHLDKMAAEGMRFTQHYAGHNVCAPDRCSIMTGLHMGHAFVRGNLQNSEGEGQIALPEGTRTIARVLQSAGYKTGMFGKWGLGNPGTTGDPLKQGWDTYFGYTDQVRAHNFYPDFLLKDGDKVLLDNEVKWLPKTHWSKGIGSYSTKQNVYSHDLIVDEALKFVKQNKENPFFLYLPVTLPHDNGEAPVLYNEVPNFGQYEKMKDWTINTKGYAEMVTRLDKTVGQVLGLLKELKIDENTLVLFTSDNGPYNPNRPQKDRLYTNFFDSNGIYRGFKRDYYEGGIRIPFLAHWPGKIKGGTVTDHISAHYDFFATACEVSGVEVPSDIDGISYLPTLLGKSKQKEHNYLYWEGGSGLAFAIRKGKWKGVMPDTKKTKNPKLEIYDLENDPSEEKNIASKHPELQKELMKLIRQAHVPSKEFPLPFLDK